MEKRFRTIAGVMTIVMAMMVTALTVVPPASADGPNVEKMKGNVGKLTELGRSGLHDIQTGFWTNAAAARVWTGSRLSRVTLAGRVLLGVKPWPPLGPADALDHLKPIAALGFPPSAWVLGPLMKGYYNIVFTHGLDPARLSAPPIFNPALQNLNRFSSIHLMQFRFNPAFQMDRFRFTPALPIPNMDRFRFTPALPIPNMDRFRFTPALPILNMDRFRFTPALQNMHRFRFNPALQNMHRFRFNPALQNIRRFQFNSDRFGFNSAFQNMHQFRFNSALLNMNRFQFNPTRFTPVYRHRDW